jgi:YebC/PmpR family DNA-binding regulatory protein
VAILIEALTDNRNRTAADLRAAFSKNGGNLGETGCVGWMFAQRGVIRVGGAIEEERLLEVSLEGGAESYEMFDDEEEGTGAEVYTAATNLDPLHGILQENGFQVTDLEIRWIPNNTIEVSESERARSLLKLIDALEVLDDVQSVTANFHLSEGLIASGI